jgi:hypothetical protein
MKTNEQKLSRLLSLARKNGYKGYNYFFSSREYKPKIDVKKCEISWEQPSGYDDIYIIIPLNDVVTNFEEDEVSFIEGLCKASKLEDVISTHPQFYRTIWIEKPTSQRLYWLFETFKHLLTK